MHNTPLMISQIISDNGEVPSGNKALSDRVLTQICVAKLTWYLINIDSILQNSTQWEYF